MSSTPPRNQPHSIPPLVPRPTSKPRKPRPPHHKPYKHFFPHTLPSIRPIDMPRPPPPYNPDNPFQDEGSQWDYIKECFDKHLGLYNELIDSGASSEAAGKVLELLGTLHYKEWKALEWEWQFNEEISRLLEEHPLTEKLGEIFG